MSNLVIAIDGPAGAGKSTIAKLISKRLNVRYLDTGAMYRAIALKAAASGLGPEDGAAAAKLMMNTDIRFAEGEPQRVLLDGCDVTDEIRTLEIGDLASALSTHGELRRLMVKEQQVLVSEGNVVLEGRDATTVIAPDATLKVYLTASLEERASRRTKELATKGLQEDYDKVRREVLLRDTRDITREDSPLTVAPDAHLIESGEHTIDEVVEMIVKLVPA
jgi:cytidylate kinase